MTRTLGLIGAPSSAGAFAPGQELAPRALRDARLVEKLGDAGLAVVDRGDSPLWRWRPDREEPFAQNLHAVVATANETARRVQASLAAGELPLVLGGDCTIELGTVAGHLSSEERIGLLYFDLHPDLNLPVSPGPGALDWTGLAHLLGEHNTCEPLSRMASRFPMLEPESVFLFAYDPIGATPQEQETIGRLGLHGISVADVANDPEAAATSALAWIGPRCDHLLIHFDVDTVDFTDLPLSENTGRNEGLPFESAMRALRVLLGSNRLSALTITELNPNHGAQDGSTIDTFVDSLVDALRPEQ